jgi:hypothetical protein
MENVLASSLQADDGKQIEVDDVNGWLRYFGADEDSDE